MNATLMGLSWSFQERWLSCKENVIKIAGLAFPGVLSHHVTHSAFCYITRQYKLLTRDQANAPILLLNFPTFRTGSYTCCLPLQSARCQYSIRVTKNGCRQGLN